MIYAYFFIKRVVRWSENSVRFEKSYGNWLPDGPNSGRFYLTVLIMACMYVLVSWSLIGPMPWASRIEFFRKEKSFLTENLD